MALQLQLHQTFPSEIRSEWDSLLDETVTHVPFLRYEYLDTWWNVRGGGEWPAEAQLAIVSARRDGQLVGIAPLFWTPDHHGQPALLLLGSVEISDYLDIIARPEDLDEFLAALLPFLREAGLPAWQTLDLYNILDSSPTLPALEKAAQAQGWQHSSEQLQHSPYIPLPGDWEAYLAGIDKKQRHEIRRKMRRAESGEVPVSWYIVSQREGLEEEIDAFINMMAQEEAKQAFLTEQMRAAMKAIIICSFEESCLHLAFLTVGGEKAAAYLAFDYLDRLWIYNSGFEPRFREYSPGWVLLGYLLQWANENKRSEFDFMRGNEDYKYRFGAIDRFVMRATLTP